MPKAFVVLKLKTAVVTFFAVFTAVAVLVLSNNVRLGIRKGLALCASNVIPSLFLFTTVALFISYSGIGRVLGQVISPITRLLLGIDNETASVFLLSAVSGYPVGAKLLETLYKDGKISRPKALKMLTFSVNAGPSFVVTAVGMCMLKSNEIGLRLLVVHLAATIIIAVFVRFLPDRLFGDNTPTNIDKTSTSRSLSDAFVTSVSDAGATMLNICAFVVFFSGISEILFEVMPQKAPELIGFLEVTVGLVHCTVKQLPFVAFLLGFGGVSVIFQIMFSAKTISPKIGVIIVSRLAHGILSALLITLINTLFPLSIEAGTFNSANAVISNNSLPAAVAMLILCATMLTFWEKSRRKTHTV